jgi:hypothetical protein
MAGTSLATFARWMAAGFEVAPQGRDWLDPDDEYGRRGPILVPIHPGVGTGWNGIGVNMRTGDVYDDPDDEVEDDPGPSGAPSAARIWRTGPAWDALVASGGFREDQDPRPRPQRRELYDWRDDEDDE